MRDDKTERPVRVVGRTLRGEDVHGITLRGPQGLVAEVWTLGATLARLLAPDRHGEPGDVVLSHDDVAGYERSRAYVGCVVGRVANRIAGARYVLDGREVRLSANEGPHHLHGGADGFHRRVFAVVEVAPDRVVLELESPHGDQGHPGTLVLRVEYAFDGDGALALAFLARTDRPTAVDPSHHAYWNLSGRPGVDVRGHTLETPATHRVQTDAALLPTGAIVPVDGTPWDFRGGASLGARLEVLGGAGFDDHLLLPGAPRGALRHAATLRDPQSGRSLVLETTLPGFQLYTGNHLAGEPGRAGAPHVHHGGVCLEPQRPPDAVHHPGFPSVILRPGEVLRERIRWRLLNA